MIIRYKGWRSGRQRGYRTLRGTGCAWPVRSQGGLRIWAAKLLDVSAEAACAGFHKPLPRSCGSSSRRSRRSRVTAERVTWGAAGSGCSERPRRYSSITLSDAGGLKRRHAVPPLSGADHSADDPKTGQRRDARCPDRCRVIQRPRHPSRLCRCRNRRSRGYCPATGRHVRAPARRPAQAARRSGPRPWPAAATCRLTCATEQSPCHTAPGSAAPVLAAVPGRRPAARQPQPPAPGGVRPRRGGVSCWSQPGATIAGLPWPAARCGCDQRHHVTGRGASALGCQSRDVTMGGPSWKAGPVPAAAAAGSRRDPWLRGFRAACVRRRPACPPAATWAACAGVVAATRPAGRLPIRRRAQGRVAPGRSRRSRRLSQQRGAP